MTADFSAVTEQAGSGATAEQIEMMYARYQLAREMGRGKDILEVACGPGMGLGYLAREARRVVGGDCTASLVRTGQAYYRDRLPLLQLDAQALPFRDGSFDVVLLYEAIYYVPDAGRFAAEAGRVLRPEGVILISTVNREWPEFHPSPHSVHYFSAAELGDLLAAKGFCAEMRAGFPVEVRGVARRTVSVLRRAASRCGLIPRTLKGRAVLKRLFYGRMPPLPPELPEGGASRPLIPVAPGPVTAYKVLYAVGRRVEGRVPDRTPDRAHRDVGRSL